MERPEGQRLLLQLLDISDHIRRRDDALLRQLTQAIAHLQDAAERVGAGGQQFASGALEVLRREGGAAVAHGLDHALQKSRAGMEAFASTGSQAAREVQAAAQSLRRQRGVWLWAAPIALIVGAVLAAGGSSYLVWKNMRELKRAQFGQDILRATETGVLTRCGDMLCVKVGKKPQRFNKDYVLLQEQASAN
jgi:hypothetical protein